MCPHAGDPETFWGRWGPAVLGLGAWLTPEKTSNPALYRAKFGWSRSNVTNVRTKIRLKKCCPRVLPFKVTQGHFNR